MTGARLRDREHTFRRTVRQWWRTHRRDLPWRRTKDPYRIFVSEVMLQQTQVNRVIPKYRDFLKKFPSLASLSRSSRSEVLRAWSGLGYNRRALNLHRAAQHIAKHHCGHIPKTLNELTLLPGVGEYTARAVLVFGYNVSVAPVDTNIRRVFIRHFGRKAAPDVQAFAERILPKRNPAEWSQMLMDFGALVCTARNAQCETFGLAHVADISPKRRPAERFENSNRYWRGRIVEILRNRRGPLLRDELSEHLRQATARTLPKRRLTVLLGDLTHDGLVAEDVRSRLTLV